MRPRTVTILVAFMLLAGVATRYAVIWGDFVPKPVDFRKATSIRITYTVGTQSKTHDVSSPIEVNNLLGSFRVFGIYDNAAMITSNNTIDFFFPDGSSVTVMLATQWIAVQPGFGQYQINPSFHSQVCALLSGLECRPIDILTNNVGTNATAGPGGAFTPPVAPATPPKPPPIPKNDAK